MKNNINIGVTEVHGAYDELIKNQIDPVSYHILKQIKDTPWYLDSPISGFYSRFDDANCDFVESVIGPVRTGKKWIMSIACFQEALAFSFFNLPTPKFLRKYLIKKLVKQDNCLGIIFWSEAGKKTLQSYGNITDPEIAKKCYVLYPAVKKRCQILRNENSTFTFTFSGDFFRKGGVNVVEMFAKLEQIYDVSLNLCCDESIDFNTDNYELKSYILELIKGSKNINLIGRLPRDVYMEGIVKNTNCYLLPSYNEAFGYSVLEFLTQGIPVITTNIMAFPEMVEHGRNGFMVDVSKYDIENIFKGYVVNNIPEDFKKTVNDQLLNYMTRLVECPQLYKNMSCNAYALANEKFSLERRNRQLLNILSS